MESDASSEDGSAYPVHGFLIADKGIHILEIMNTAGLAADNASEFLSILGTSRVEGLAHAIITPLVIR
ncbi:hypothetical protein [Altererythrobacter sp. GH1-8]|uniref:hypothetical protein n=1 Tax=Altererythrobacter sp. GH1-8 TaxID=3349333 RepID=UPI00374D3EC3